MNKFATSIYNKIKLYEKISFTYRIDNSFD